MLKVVLTGSPASGKTTLMSSLALLINDDFKNKVVFIPESATQIIKTTPPDVMKDVSPFAFQRLVYNLQVKNETNAEKDGYEFAILDRGCADGFVYLMPEVAELALEKSQAELLGQYDFAIFLLGGRAENFLNDKKTKRRENSLEEIKYLEKRSFEVWREHPNIVFVPQHDKIEDKAKSVAMLINDFLGIKLFLV